MPLETVLKQPAEQLHRPITFNGVSTVTAFHDVTAVARGLVASAVPLTVVPTLALGAVMLAISGGSDGERYLITARADDADGQTAETELEILVVDAAWAMPDGGAPWLSITEFVDRVGLPEVIAATDGIGDGRIDRGLLVGALVAAQAVTQAHIAGRFTVQIGAVPEILKTIITDLARARLYPNGPSKGVEDQAKASTRMLERIQAGTMPLGDEAAPEAPSASPVLIAPGSVGRLYPDGLAGFRR